MELVLAAALSRATGWYDEKLRLLAAVVGSLEKLHRMPASERSHLLPPAAHSAVRQAWSSRELKLTGDLLQQYDIKGVCLRSPDYPQRLGAIDDPPYVLYYRGDLAVLHRPMVVSCVGTRAMTVYGKRVVVDLITGLRGLECCVVSGLALGIDGQVHQSALACQVATAAVLGGGLDRFEPVTNARLGRKIADQYVVVSEYPPGVRPQKHHFLSRNRIIAGLSQATVVIEGRENSGALVTARAAGRYGRDVGAVPGDIFLPGSQGPHQLLADGATPVIGRDSFLLLCGLEPRSRPVSDSSNPIVSVLRAGPLTLDKLHSTLDVELSDLQRRLTLLEMDGAIGTTAQGQYYLVDP